jgi:glycosyltransferase involved in cell wall biosynthesis
LKAQSRSTAAPRVSVIIPLFNLKEYVGDAIDSALRQTYGNIEVIVIDDGSDDRPDTVLSKYGRLIEVLRQEHRGPSSARNSGIRMARGKYLLFLDADDYIGPDKVEIQVEGLETHPELGWVYGNSLTIDQDGNVLRRLPEAAIGAGTKAPQGIIFEKLFRRNFIAVNAAMVRKNIAIAEMFDESLRGFEDWDFFLRISARYQVGHTGKAMAFVRFRPDSSQGNVVGFYSDKLRVIRKMCELYPDLTKPVGRQVKATVAETYNIVGEGYEERGNMSNAISQYLSSVTTYPFQKTAYRNMMHLTARFLWGILARHDEGINSDT